MSLSRPLGNLQKPQWFICIENQKLKMNEIVLSDLRGLGSHLVVVAVAGSLRTGKSWIISQLAGCGARNGFEVADGQTAVTSGIWILCRKHPQKQNCVVVFLDTEGLHDPFKNDTENEDNRHFILAFLLSDIFIFNAMHKFDNNDLEKIGFITMICKKLQKTDAQKSFPEFLLLLRDVAHVKLHGRSVQPSEYLENVLKPSEDANDRFSPKWCIREHCQRRTCFTLTQPVEFEDLSELGQMDDPTLKSRFVDDERKLKDHLYTNIDIKRFANHSPYTTSAFCAYTTALVANVEDGVIPKVSSLQERIAVDENKRVLEEATVAFKTGMRDEEKSNLYESLSEKYNVLQRQGIEHLDHHLIPMSQDHKNEIIHDFKEFTQEEYLMVSAEKSREYLMGLLEPHFMMVEDSAYNAPNAKETFENDVKKVQGKYEKMRNLGPEKTNIWNEIKREIKRKTKEVELVDLRHQFHATDKANKEEKERLEQMVKKMENDIKEQKLEIERKARAAAIELELKRKKDELEMEQKRQRYEHQLEKKKDEAISEIKTHERHMVQAMEAERRRQVESANEANVFSSLIDGISLVGATTIAALGNLSTDDD